MRAMAISWRWRQAVFARILLSLLALTLCSITSANAQESTGWTANDTARLSALASEQAVAVDWYWLGEPPDAQAGSTDLTVRFLGPGPQRDLPQLLDLSVTDPRAGLSTRVLYVMDGQATASLPAQRTSAAALLSALAAGQSAELVWQTEGAWHSAGEISTPDQIDALNPPEEAANIGISPEDFLAQQTAQRTFVILARGSLASPALSMLAETRGERFYVITADWPDALPGNGFLPLQSLETPGLASALSTQFASGRVALFDGADHYHLPGEGQGQVKVTLGSAGAPALTVELALDTRPAGFGVFFNPFNGFRWLATGGRRLYGLATLAGWASVLGALLFLLRIRRQPTEALAEIEIYSLGLSAKVTHLPFTIGRAGSCDLMIPDEETSRRHAEIRRSSQGGLELVDLMSANGTFLESERLNQPAALGTSQNVTFGGMRGHIRLTEAGSEG